MHQFNTDDDELVYRLFVAVPPLSFRNAAASKFRICAHRECDHQRKRFATYTFIIVHHNHYHHRRHYHCLCRLIIVGAVTVAIISSTLWGKTRHANVRLLCCA